MISNLSKLEVKVGERVYQLLCHCESPVAECRQVLSQFDSFLVQIEENAKKAAEEAAQKAEVPIEVPVEALVESPVEDATMVQ